MEDEEPAGRAAEGAKTHTGYDIGRLLAFSDGVFAIAITLLVLSIPVPSGPAAQLAGQLQALTSNVLVFCFSFALVGAQWILHHRMLRPLTFCDNRVLWLNLLVLFGICLVPFSTSLLVRYGDTSLGAVAYGSVMLLIGLAFLALRIYLTAHGAGTRTSMVLGLPRLAGFAISIPVAFRSVQIAYFLWVAGVGLAVVLEARSRAATR
jgi:uncharacterized membrane protein